ncbi:glutamate-1-semialdehyde 2,1-aminomutase [Chlamydia sp. 17-3921]|uniref:glutamate-1-semialdehyde 2,1-aminomutase n=1 Tax=Chlamydia sp. 17-3921 TaxID=2675798 RepID=UPI001918EB09|nr:glutamate-1-semialdehyde 2,1-aminomutase [Chlamydia sp. 17-3921]
MTSLPEISNISVVHSEACQLFPGGVNSPVRACRSVGVCPPIVASAKDDIFINSEGEEYIDFCGSWGALIHGHGHPEIVDAIAVAASKGSSYGITSFLEISFAKKLLSYLGLQEHKVRFVSTGTEATMTSVRLACSITGRSILIKFSGGYHGHADVFLNGISITLENIESLNGLKLDNASSLTTLILPYNDLELFQQVMKSIGSLVAAVIFEPVCANMGVISPLPEVLEGIIATCHSYKSLSIMDEVVTGFRLAFGGARETFRLEPDITVYGKILGGGTPAAAIVAHKSIMDNLMPQGTVFQAGTFSGNSLAMAAGCKSLELCRKEGFYQKLKDLELFFYQPIEDAIAFRQFPVSLSRQGSMFTFFFSEKVPTNFEEVCSTNLTAFKNFYRLVFDDGVYLSPSPLEASFISSVHKEENLAYAQNVIIDSLIKLFDKTVV